MTSNACKIIDCHCGPCNLMSVEKYMRNIKLWLYAFQISADFFCGNE